MPRQKTDRGKLNLVLKGRIWHAHGTLNGRRIRRSTGCTEKSHAREVCLRWEQEAHDIRIYGEEAVLTFPQAVMEYTQDGGDPRFLEPLLDYYGVTPILQITPRNARAAARNLYPAAKPSTWNRQVIAPTSAVINHALAGTGREKRNFPRFKEPAGRLIWITPEQAEDFLKACAYETKKNPAGDLPVMATVGFGTGLRRSELMALDHEFFYPAAAQFFIPYEKAGEGRMVAYPSRVAAALSTLPDRTGSLWRTPRGKDYGKRATSRTLSWRWQAFQAAAERAGMPELTPHIMRHTFATWFCAQTKDLLRCQQLGGWSRLSTLQRYAKVAPADLGERLLDHGWDFRPLSDTFLARNWQTPSKRRLYDVKK